jgi:glucose/arabinose dehydrogenase
VLRSLRYLAAIVLVVVPATAGAGLVALEPRSTRVGFSTLSLRLVPLVDGLEQPVDLATTPGEPDRLYVVEQTGRIRIVERGRVLPKPLLDIRHLTRAQGERGLLGLAFHPRYTVDRRFYVHYTDLLGNTRVAEYRLVGEEGVAVRQRPLLFVHQPYENHKGGQLAFGPDGRLYLALGDGGSAFDPEGRAQDLASPLGKLLRLDVERAASRWEVVGLGLRNPWRFTFDRATGDLYIADVGQDHWEEINFVRAGTRRLLNFGWDVYEGADRIEPKDPAAEGDLIWPVAVYGHGARCSVTGGVVYRGDDVTGLRGRYLYGDFCSGEIWSLRVTLDGRADVRAESVDLPGISTFGQGANGEIYLASHAGDVYRLARRGRAR